MIMTKYSINAHTSKVLTNELLNHLLQQFPLGNSVIHGESHWLRVLYNGRIVKSGTKELALDLEEKGYDWIIKELEKK